MFGGLATIARKYAYKIPLLLKLNQNDLLTYPNKFDQVLGRKSFQKPFAEGGQLLNAIQDVCM